MMTWHGASRQTIRAFLGSFIVVLLVITAHAEEAKTLKGVALVIGQSKYTHITPLANPANDALQTSGKLNNDAGKLNEAVAAYQAALGEYSLERTPMPWATAQSMMGTALEAIGFAGGGPEKLKEAVAAKRAALTVLTKDNARLEWAQAQFNVGNSLNMIGNFEKGTESFEAAIAAFNAALEVYTLVEMPLQWGIAQNGIGDSHWGLGTRRNDKTAFKSSLARFEKAKEGLAKGGMAAMAALVDKKIAIIEESLAAAK